MAELRFAGVGLPIQEDFRYEHVVGTWLDGKPIYCRVIRKYVTTTGVSQITLFDKTDFDIDTIVDIRGYFHGDTSANQSALALNSPTGNNTGFYIGNARGDTKVILYYINKTFTSTDQHADAIIYYTKTTD